MVPKPRGQRLLGGTRRSRWAGCPGPAARSPDGPEGVSCLYLCGARSPPARPARPVPGSPPRPPCPEKPATAPALPRGPRGVPRSQGARAAVPRLTDAPVSPRGLPSRSCLGASGPRDTRAPFRIRPLLLTLNTLAGLPRAPGAGPPPPRPPVPTRERAGQDGRRDPNLRGEQVGGGEPEVPLVVGQAGLHLPPTCAASTSPTPRGARTARGLSRKAGARRPPLRGRGAGRAGGAPVAGESAPRPAGRPSAGWRGPRAPLPARRRALRPRRAPGG